MAQETPLRERREALVREHMEAENRLNFDAALATFGHPRYELIGTGDVFDGADAVSRYFRESRTPFPDQSNEIISLRHADDAVIVEFWLTGTHKGELRGMPPTGKRFRARMCGFFIFDGDRLICERIYFDTMTIMRQLAEGEEAD